MLEAVFATCNANCTTKQSRGNAADKPFNLSVLVHSAKADNLGLLQSSQPSVSVTVGNMTKDTEPGEWSKEKGQWTFMEAVTVEVNSKDSISVAVFSSGGFNLLSNSPHSSGAHIIQVAEVLPRLRVDDRASEGLVYATPVMGYDLTEDRKALGRIFLSFETKTPVPLMRGGNDDTMFSSMGTDALWQGPADWKPGSPNKRH